MAKQKIRVKVNGADREGEVEPRMLLVHFVRETLSLVDRAYLIHDGKVMIQGKPDMIAADPEARRVYLGESFSVG